jgi:hypothetical protein
MIVGNGEVQRYVCSMIRWNIRKRADKLGMTNAHELSVRAGLSYPVARRVWAEEAPARLDVGTLEALAVVFKVKTPWELLTYEPRRRSPSSP